jgi:uncharacterized protein DUF4279
VIIVHTYSVQLRISGKSLDPGEITRQLGLEPNQVRIAGERRSNSKVWEEHLWSFDGAADPHAPMKEWGSIEDGLVYVLGRLLPKKDLIRAYTASFDVIWWCGHFQSSFDGGPTLSVPLLHRLADFGVPIFIDNYFRSDDSE